MSRCQNSQSNSQSCKELLKLLKWNSNQKKNRGKANEKGFAVTQSIQYYSHGPLIAWSGVLLVSVLQSSPNISWMLNMCSFWSCQSLQPQRNQIPSALEHTEHLWPMRRGRVYVSVRVETWLLPERLKASDIRRWCSYQADSKETILSKLRWPKFSATFASRRREMYVFRPGWMETLHYNPAFSLQFFVDFNRKTFISSCFRGGTKRANTVGYALALTGSGPSFMFPHRNIVVSFSVSRQSNVFTFQPASTKAKVEGKYPPYGKLKDLRFFQAFKRGFKFSASKTFVFFCLC